MEKDTKTQKRPLFSETDAVTAAVAGGLLTAFKEPPKGPDSKWQIAFGFLGRVVLAGIGIAAYNAFVNAWNSLKHKESAPVSKCPPTELPAAINGMNSNRSWVDTVSQPAKDSYSKSV